jgi:hypothetical protein
MTYTWKRLECDVCKVPYPEGFSYKDNHFQLTKADVPTEPHIILESLPNQRNSQRCVFVLQKMLSDFVDANYANEKVEFLLGRGHDNNVRITDISVSRVHSKIIY